MGVNYLKELSKLDGPLVIFSDTMSTAPIGPVGALAQYIPHLHDYITQRQTEGSKGFCLAKKSDTLGTHKRIPGSPEIFLLIHTLSYVLVENNQEQVRRPCEKAPPAIKNEMNRNNASERGFFAQLALDDLLNAWEHKPPASKIYLVAHTEPQDP